MSWYTDLFQPQRQPPPRPVEPAGYDVIRDLLMRKMFELQSNPYGAGAMQGFSNGLLPNAAMGGGNTPGYGQSSGGVPGAPGSGGGFPGGGGGGGMGGGMGGGRPGGGMPQILPPRPVHGDFKAGTRVPLHANSLLSHLARLSGRKHFNATPMPPQQQGNSGKPWYLGHPEMINQWLAQYGIHGGGSDAQGNVGFTGPGGGSYSSSGASHQGAGPGSQSMWLQKLLGFSPTPASPGRPGYMSQFGVNMNPNDYQKVSGVDQAMGAYRNYMYGQKIGQHQSTGQGSFSPRQWGPGELEAAQKSAAGGSSPAAIYGTNASGQVNPHGAAPPQAPQDPNLRGRSPILGGR